MKIHLERREATRQPSGYMGEIPSYGRMDLKHVAFCAIGGGGSSALIHRVSRYARFCGMRPDNYFLPAGGFDRILEPGALHPDVDDGMDTFLISTETRSAVFDLDAVLAGFHRQTGYWLDLRLTIGANLERYLSWLREHDGAAVFWQLPTFRFFSTREIMGVVFLIRRPLDAFLSFTEPYRHVALFDDLGGREAEKSMALFCRWWCAHAAEYFRLLELNLDPVLIRYDRASQDAEALPQQLRAQFTEEAGWEPRLRGDIDAPERVREFILDHTAVYSDLIWGRP